MNLVFHISEDGSKIQLVASLWIASFDSELATSLMTTCNRLVITSRHKLC